MERIEFEEVVRRIRAYMQVMNGTISHAERAAAKIKNPIARKAAQKENDEMRLGLASAHLIAAILGISDEELKKPMEPGDVEKVGKLVNDSTERMGKSTGLTVNMTTMGGPAPERVQEIIQETISKKQPKTAAEADKIMAEVKQKLEREFPDAQIIMGKAERQI